MSVEISYMGTKKQLAPYVRELCEGMKRGPLLDLFSGICAVGSEMAATRDIWCNDSLLFPHLVAKTLFQTPDHLILDDKFWAAFDEFFKKNRDSLSERFSSLLNKEIKVFNSYDYEALSKIHRTWQHVGNSVPYDLERARLQRKPSTFPYRLFTITFAGGYFGLSQSIAIDSLRYAIDKSVENRMISRANGNKLLLALCQTLSKSSTSPGHFAQYIKPKSSNIKYIVHQREVDIYRKWRVQVEKFEDVSFGQWRKGNKAFNRDADSLLTWLKHKNYKPGIIYADPPYTDDQYSRYYHVYETLLKYDYPASSGEGRYRPDRFRSDFSLKSNVDKAFFKLIKKSSELNSDILISYPSKGCLSDSTNKITELLGVFYNDYGVAKAIDYKHSTMGASKGSSTNPVEEIIFYGRGKRA